MTASQILLTLAGLACIVLLYAALIEPRWLEVVNYHLRNGRLVSGKLQELAGPLPAVPVTQLPLSAPSDEPSDTLRLAFFSDVHAGFNSISSERLAEIIIADRPDVVCFGGDLVNGKWDRGKGLDWIKKLSTALTEHGIKLFAVRGNHDQSLSDSDLTGAGALLLDNRSARVTAADGSLWQLIGLEDLRTGEPDFAQALHTDSNTALAASHRIVLTHNPDTVLSLHPKGQALVLCGHFHGGQIRLPFRLEFRSLRGEKLCRAGFYHGLFSWGDFSLILTRGIGCVLFPFRLGARPELTLITLQQAISQKNSLDL